MTHRWEVRLAHAVLETACADARIQPPTTGEHVQELRDRRDSARAFLAGGPMLMFWCAVAGLSADAIQDAVRRHLREDR